MEDLASMDLTFYGITSTWSLQYTAWRARWQSHALWVLQYNKIVQNIQRRKEGKLDAGGTNQENKPEKREKKWRLYLMEQNEFKVTEWRIIDSIILLN